MFPQLWHVPLFFSFQFTTISILWSQRSSKRVVTWMEKRFGRVSIVGLSVMDVGTCQGTWNRNILVWQCPVIIVMPRLPDVISLDLIWNTSTIWFDPNKHLDIDADVLFKMSKSWNEYNEPVWNCNVCDYSHKKKTNTFRHVECKHVSCSFTCPLCQLPQTCRNSLKQHLALKHNQSNDFWK